MRSWEHLIIWYIHNSFPERPKVNSYPGGDTMFWRMTQGSRYRLLDPCREWRYEMYRGESASHQNLSLCLWRFWWPNFAICLMLAYVKNVAHGQNNMDNNIFHILCPWGYAELHLIASPVSSSWDCRPLNCPNDMEIRSFPIVSPFGTFCGSFMAYYPMFFGTMFPVHGL